MKSTSRTDRVKRKPARRITKANRDALNLLYGPPESHEQDDGKPDAHIALPKTRNHKNHREEEF